MVDTGGKTSRLVAFDAGVCVWAFYIRTLECCVREVLLC